VVLNSRPFPPSCPLFPSRLLPMVTQWSSHIRAMDVWGDEDFLEPAFFDILTTLDNLRSFRQVLSWGHFPFPDNSELMRVQHQLPA
jgi:hypothetical protein